MNYFNTSYARIRILIAVIHSISLIPFLVLLDWHVGDACSFLKYVYGYWGSGFCDTIKVYLWLAVIGLAISITILTMGYLKKLNTSIVIVSDLLLIVSLIVLASFCSKYAYEYRIESKKVVVFIGDKRMENYNRKFFSCFITSAVFGFMAAIVYLVEVVFHCKEPTGVADINKQSNNI